MGTDATSPYRLGPNPLSGRVTIIIPTIVADQAMLNRCISQVWSTARDVETLVPRDRTFAENCNQAARDATTEMLVFLNDDTLPQPGWLEPLIGILDAGAHIAGSRLTYPDGTIQHAGIYFGLVDGVLHGFNYTEERDTGPVDAVTGACMAIRRDDFLTLDGFDEAFINGNEDVDFCLRVRQHGGRIVYCAESTVIHYESRSGPARWSHVTENVQRLNDLWLTKLAHEPA